MMASPVSGDAGDDSSMTDAERRRSETAACRPMLAVHRNGRLPTAGVKGCGRTRYPIPTEDWRDLVEVVDWYNDRLVWHP
jgi:hypothetical protein